MTINQPLIFVSYRLGTSKSGGVMNEYSEDKLRIIEKLGIKTFAVTGLHSVPIPRANIRYFRVPSLSLFELRIQLNDLRKCNHQVPLQFYCILPFALTFGLLLDILLKFFLKSNFGGFWSWSLTSLPVVIYLKIRYGAKNLLATGGASAGIIGALAHRLTGIHFYWEVPDPIVGVTMHYSKKRLKRIEKLESILIDNSIKTIFTTKFAALLASNRCPRNNHKITSIYPGAWNFSTQKRIKADNKINFVHLGSLYGSRNLDLFLEALSHLEKTGFLNSAEIRVINIGTIDMSVSNYYLDKFELVLIPESSRDFVLEIASTADILLLIQHMDSRSRETIPFKLYDYLNLRLPILGLIDNSEIEHILLKHKEFLSSVGDIESIKSAISSCITSVRNGFEVDYQLINEHTQFRKIFD